MKLIVSVLLAFLLGLGVGILVNTVKPSAPSDPPITSDGSASAERGRTESLRTGAKNRNPDHGWTGSVPTGASTTASKGLHQDALVKGGRLHVVTRELVPGSTDAWESTEYAYAATFRFVAVDGRGSTELYVAGFDNQGRDHLERWTTLTQDGAYFVELPRASSTVGVPLPPLPSARLGVQGGKFIPPAQRPGPPRQSRMEICSGELFGGIKDLIADPEGRFVFVLGALPPAVYRVLDVEGSLPEKLFDQRELPDLDETEGFFVRQHVSRGRCYTFDNTLALDPKRVRYSFLWDNDNDGNIDSLEQLTADEYAARGYAGPVWLTNFRQY